MDFIYINWHNVQNPFIVFVPYFLTTNRKQIVYFLHDIYLIFSSSSIFSTWHIKLPHGHQQTHTDPKVIIIDEKGGPLQDKYYEVDSTIQLSCIVRHVAMTTTAVFWSHGERILNYDVDRGGIRYCIFFANSVLEIYLSIHRAFGIHANITKSTRRKHV